MTIQLGEDAIRQAFSDAQDKASLAVLLDSVSSLVRRYVVTTHVQGDCVALWIAHAHTVGAFDTTPYLSVRSAEKRSGKTRLLEVIELLVPAPLRADSISVAALARSVAEGCTLLLDEVDSIFGRRREVSESQETLRGILNSGYRRGGAYVRMVGVGAAMTPQRFSTFGAKVLSGIGTLPGTLEDRAVGIELRRRSSSEPVERFRQREAIAQFQPVRDCLATWAATALDTLRAARPVIPEALDDRAADGWEPLLAIADMAGRGWPDRARVSALALSTGEAREDESLGVRLLSDIKAVMDVQGIDRILTRDLTKALAEKDESPWVDTQGKPIDGRKLSTMLKPYKVKPTDVRVESGNGKGYRREDFLDAWGRYLRPIPVKAGDKRDKGDKSGSGDVTLSAPVTGDNAADAREEQKYPDDLQTPVTGDKPHVGDAAQQSKVTLVTDISPFVEDTHRGELWAPPRDGDWHPVPAGLTPASGLWLNPDRTYARWPMQEMSA